MNSGFYASSGGWLLLTGTQSILSITLIALFLLAIRWRFRKGSK